MSIQVFGATCKGIRTYNEDRFLAPFRGRYAVVADGMGASADGEWASELAVTRIEEVLSKREVTAESFNERLRAVHEEIGRIGAEDPTRIGASTGFTGGFISQGRLHVAHVGDGRCYVLRDGELRQLTVDQTLGQKLKEQGREPPNPGFAKVVLATVGLGDFEVVNVEEDLIAGDRLLFCTDGVWDGLPDEQIARILAGAPEIAVKQLVERGAKESGDNATAVVMVMGVARD